MPNHLTIAIDGPVASGKSTVGRIVARKLGCRFLDTGWMYRAVAHAGLSARTRSSMTKIEMTQLAGSLTMRLVESEHGERFSSMVRMSPICLHEPLVDQGASSVAAISGVRRALVHQQRKIAADGLIVMAGRDIGTVVLPSASKFYLDASPETRAVRRYEERKDTPGSSSYGEVLESLIARDRMDSERSDSPLHPAHDAVIIDTDNLDASETARRIVELIEGA